MPQHNQRRLGAMAQSIVSRQVSFDDSLQSKLSVGTDAALSLDGLQATVDMGHPFYKLSSSMGLICVEARRRAPLVTLRRQQETSAIFIPQRKRVVASQLLNQTWGDETD
ncbi:hypothetical protein GTR04_0918 [Trichophyton interdigitale]|uniref:Uncharacterized protein n=2 Tax=Trichophyton interdigitale TaxID=101480 RepID=A0A9P4YNB2_9EURO|nr:hypothetical protein GY631_0659 [Trichophyton interdigitale]KAF3900802.1 hypothetical protein GY632_0543 [Trichophyton interdigitale]KAG8211711.1 hypothetical protein GTR04_0918 [Trichophyton interdigitale]KDB24108.1 hypothetical protein H109_04053 [Trichophyton interdigitale MR816]